MSGFPASANGASSFHLWWDPAPGPGIEASVTVLVEEEPRHPHLVFWALQVGFTTDLGHRTGAAHLGLQWNPRHPSHRAVNWGGYAEDGAVLEGSPSPLPSTPRDPNTRDFSWEPGRRYRLAVRRAGDGAWDGYVDGGSGPVLVRRLFNPGTGLVSPVVWTECFARCSDPSVSVVWSDPEMVTGTGLVSPSAYRVTYQSASAGGCPNTNSSTTAAGVRQATNVSRTTPDGARLGPKEGQGPPRTGR